MLSDDDNSSYLFNATCTQHHTIMAVSSESSYDTEEDDRSISTTEALFPGTFDDLGLPSLGCIMDF